MYRGMADKMCPQNRLSLLRRQMECHISFVVQSLAERAIYPINRCGHPLVVCRQKVYGFPVHPILVRHSNDAILKRDQVGGPA
jgi:hypothetical protein